MRPAGFHTRFPEVPGSAVAASGAEVVFEQNAPPAICRAVMDGLADAPALFAEALRVAPSLRPYQRVEIALHPGADTQGEALFLGQGAIRLSIGERTPAEEARRIARHEALHLLLTSSLRGGASWSDPELAFAEWIVRGIESGLAADVPRFRAPLPELLQRLPRSRAEVQQHLALPPAAARRYFGEALSARLATEAGQRRLWLVEAALGVHHLEAAARLGKELRAVVLDDWLFDYEQYARALGNAPSDAGNLWRLSDRGWSDDPLLRLSVAAQALQRDDHSFFSGERAEAAAEPLVWKNRGRIRLPLVPSPGEAQPLPLHRFRAALSGLDARVLEDAARGEARFFEARALWPRIVARLLAAGARLPDAKPAAVPAAQIVDGPGAAQAHAQWQAAADFLRRIAGDWTPQVLEPRELSFDGARPAGSLLLVYCQPPAPQALVASRRLAAQQPVRGAAFRDHLDEGRAFEQLPDFDEPVDPRFRDEIWTPGPLPQGLAQLAAAADAATQEGRLTTPLSHLLSMLAFGVEECHYPRPQR